MKYFSLSAYLFAICYIFCGPKTYSEWHLDVEYVIKNTQHAEAFSETFISHLGCPWPNTSLHRWKGQCCPKQVQAWAFKNKDDFCFQQPH